MSPLSLTIALPLLDYQVGPHFSIPHQEDPMPKGRRKRMTYTEGQRRTVLLAAQKEGLTALQVQKRFGVKPITYYSWRKKRGVAARRGGRSLAILARSGD